MPNYQPAKITIGPNDWDELLKQLNYLLKDIYNWIDNIMGVGDKVFEPAAITLPPSATYSSGIIKFPPPTELTISGGEIILTGAGPWHYHSIHTEGNAASDDLALIRGGSAGDLLLLKAANDVQTVVVKSNTATIMQADFSLDSVQDRLLLQCEESDLWYALSRAHNA